MKYHIEQLKCNRNICITFGNVKIEDEYYSTQQFYEL